MFLKLFYSYYLWILHIRWFLALIGLMLEVRLEWFTQLRSSPTVSLFFFPLHCLGKLQFLLKKIDNTRRWWPYFTQLRSSPTLSSFFSPSLPEKFQLLLKKIHNLHRSWPYFTQLRSSSTVSLFFIPSLLEENYDFC